MHFIRLLPCQQKPWCACSNASLCGLLYEHVPTSLYSSSLLPLSDKYVPIWHLIIYLLSLDLSNLFNILETNLAEQSHLPQKILLFIDLFELVFVNIFICFKNSDFY